MNTINMKAYQADYYTRNRSRILAKRRNIFCAQCGERPARKNRPRCSRCEKNGPPDTGSRLRAVRCLPRPANLVPTGELIHDVKKCLIDADGRPRPIPADLLRRRFLSSAPGDSRWLIVWRVDNSIKSKAG
jgi:hypothetical protein